MSVNSKNIPTAKQKQLQKNPLYIYWECQTLYSTSYLKLDNTHSLHLFVDMYILKFFLKKKHDFARLTFSFKKFLEIRQNLYFCVSKIAFQLVIFCNISKTTWPKQFLTPLWNNNTKL